MKQIFYTLIITLITAANTLGQAHVTLYYNTSHEITTLEKSAFKREAILDLEEMSFNGNFKDYDKQGSLIAEGTYIDGEKAGVFKTYNSEGLESVIEYANGEFALQEFIGPEGEKLVTKGTGKFSIPFTFQGGNYEIKSGGKGIVTGEFYNGKRVGLWKYTMLNKDTKYEEVYEDGILLSRTGFYKSMTFDLRNSFKTSFSLRYSDFEKFDFDHSAFENLYQSFVLYPLQGTGTLEREIMYPGGISKLLTMIRENITYPAVDMRNGIQGQVIVSVIIDEHGKVKEKKIIKSLSPTLDSEALRIIKLVEEKLCPAMYEGRSYESSFSIPISFRIG